MGPESPDHRYFRDNSFWRLKLLNTLDSSQGVLCLSEGGTSTIGCSVEGIYKQTLLPLAALSVCQLFLPSTVPYVPLLLGPSLASQPFIQHLGNAVRAKKVFIPDLIPRIRVPGLVLEINKRPVIQRARDGHTGGEAHGHAGESTVLGPAAKIC